MAQQPHSVSGSHGLLNDAGRSIELIPVDKLTPYPGNARKHSRKQILLRSEARLTAWSAATSVAAALSVIAFGARLPTMGECQASVSGE